MNSRMRWRRCTATRSSCKASITDERAKGAADALLQEVRNLSEMTTAFLNFARPQTLQFEEISVHELIEECTRELKPLVEERKIELQVDVPERCKRFGGSCRCSHVAPGALKSDAQCCRSNSRRSG